jgi:diguanylate cyclase (GGDEF)-like protein/PAS domain S-box-containing protein
MNKILHECSEVGVFKADTSGKLIYANECFCKIIGYSFEQLVNNDWVIAVHKDDRPRVINSVSNAITHKIACTFNFRFSRKGHSFKWVCCHIIPENMNDDYIHYTGVITDITQAKRNELNLRKSAGFDALTELPNRKLFNDILNKAILNAARKKTKLALFYIDLDNFKYINDFFGHGVGDQLLKAAGFRLKAGMHQSDFVARVGGDEFAIVIENFKNIIDVGAVADRIIQRFNIPFIVDANELVTTMSIGIAIFPDEVISIDSFIKFADQALYQAKDSGRNCYKFYNKFMHDKFNRRANIQANLLNVLEKKELEIYYQPQISLINNKIIGIEALLRWNNNVLNNPSPVEFIPIAEESGLINKIGLWVLENTLRQYKIWHDTFKEMNDVHICINLSSSQLYDSCFIDVLSQILRETNIQGSNIIFEITETAIMKKMLDSESLLQTFLHELNIGLSIDDFGTGYSSLVYLKKLLVTEIKIDKSFIDDIGKDPDNETMIKTIISLAKIMSLHIVAEGVETQEQIDFLRANECNIVQGYYFSKPLPADKMTDYIKKNLNPDI